MVSKQRTSRRFCFACRPRFSLKVLPCPAGAPVPLSVGSRRCPGRFGLAQRVAVTHPECPLLCAAGSQIAGRDSCKFEQPLVCSDLTPLTAKLKRCIEELILSVSCVAHWAQLTWQAQWAEATGILSLPHCYSPRFLSLKGSRISLTYWQPCFTELYFNP